MNATAFAGNLTADPELSFTPNGTAVAKFTVAVNRRISDGKGGFKDQVDGFFSCVAWRKLAEHLAESTHKGTRVVVVGRLTQRSWEAPDGSRRTAVEVQVDDIGASLRYGSFSAGGGEEE
ncbi:MAG: single-stranded DNA-binding protein [Candidatus Rokuibacteriota bacterium]